MFALLATVTGLGLMNVEEWRHGMERMNPAEYLTTSYYEHWLHSVVDLLDQKNILSVTDLEGGWLRLSAEVEPRMDQMKETEARRPCCGVKWFLAPWRQVIQREPT